MASKFLYKAEIKHDQLNKYRIIKAETQYELDQKCNNVMAQWNTQWAKIVERRNRIRSIEDSIAYAIEMTSQAEAVQQDLGTILLNSLRPYPFNIEKLKDFSEYSVPEPQKPFFQQIPPKPNRTQLKYNTKPSFPARIIKKKRIELKESDTAAFQADLDVWQAQKKLIEEANELRSIQYQEALAHWNQNKANFKHKQTQVNQEIDTLYASFSDGEPAAVEWYFKVALEDLANPIDYEKKVDVEYTAENKMLVIDIALPKKDDIPTLKKLNYIKSRMNFKKFINQKRT